MRKHTKIYMKSLGYDTCDFMPCEITGSRGIDIHHIVDRENRIENLMLLTRVKHTELGEIKSKMGYLLETHRDFLMMNGVKFDNKWFNDNIEKYKAYEVR
tara:strand:- start:3842 stop:4141 length:300 start_codon:yes stop_codon:yes gene_type:complete